MRRLARTCGPTSEPKESDTCNSLDLDQLEVGSTCFRLSLSVSICRDQAPSLNDIACCKQACCPSRKKYRKEKKDYDADSEKVNSRYTSRREPLAMAAPNDSEYDKYDFPTNNEGGIAGSFGNTTSEQDDAVGKVRSRLIAKGCGYGLDTLTLVSAI